MEAEAADLTENYDHLFVIKPIYPLVALASTCFFGVMFLFINPSWSKRMFPEYIALAKNSRADWDSRVSGTIHSLIVTPLAFYVVFFDKEVYNDPVWGKSVVSRVAMATTQGFMLADLLVKWKYFSWKLDIVVISCHHLATLYPYTYNVLYGPMPFFGCFMLLTEGSTPFVNTRWFLHVMKRSDGDLYFYNGLIMTVTFFLLRIVTIPFYWMRVYHTFTTHPMPGLNSMMKASMLIGSTMLSSLNIYWGWQVVQGGRKVVQRRAKRREEEVIKAKIS